MVTVLAKAQTVLPDLGESGQSPYTMSDMGWVLHGQHCRKTSHKAGTVQTPLYRGDTGIQAKQNSVQTQAL